MRQILTMLALGAALTMGAQAQPAPGPQPSPKAQFAADSKAAAARYEDDKRLCNDETPSAARLQCRRDAKAEYDSALAAAKARLAAAPPAPAAAAVPVQAACEGCGQVAAVVVKEEAGKGGPTGLIAGGVGGALLGRQIGGGSGKDIATIAGAVGGAYAGKKIEEKMTAHQVWTVTVKYPNGTSSSFAFDKDPGFKVGDAVRNSGNTVVRR